MEGEKDVILHVYELQSRSSSGSFLSRVLPSLGMAPYHTSLEVDGYRYTFAANAGIVKTASRNEGVPPGATYKEAIPLGGCSCNRGEINAIIKKMGQNFHGRSYHLVHRNCNSFTETLATALVLNEKLMDPKQGRLETYPDWINRLANSSKVLISHDDDIVPCDPLAEARKATGADEKIGWDLSKSKAKASVTGSSKKTGKKQLTEKQKAVLAKIKGSGGGKK